MRWSNFIYGGHESQSWRADQERTVNLLLERMESPGATSPAALYPTPGVTMIGTGTGSPGRGHFYENGREFCVQGTVFSEIDEAGNVTVRGSVATSSTPATIFSNGDGGGQLLIASGGNAYSYDLTTNVLTQVAAMNGKATMVNYLDGYGVAINRATSTEYISALLDFTTWTTGTDFAQRSKAPDPWVAMTVHGQYVFNGGEHTSEFWYNAGTASYPFAPHPNGLIPHGVAAPFSIAVGEGSLIWLAQSKVGQRYVVRATGFTPQVISTVALQNQMAAFDSVEDAVGEFINWNGHQLYVLTFPTADFTCYYDLSTNVWGEWRTWISEENDYAALRQRFHVVAFGEHRMLDAETGTIYRLDGASFLDADDREIRRLRRAPVVSNENDRIQIDEFELLMETGVGTETGDDVTPVVMMRHSKDGGKNWGNERPRSAGKVGEYSKRVIWHRLGLARQHVVEVSWTANAAFRLIDGIARGPGLRGRRAA